MKYGFTKQERSTFSYWFAHWCAFQMVALNLHVWRPKYLLHDIEKPWLKLFMTYDKVQRHHRNNNNHHLEWLRRHKVENFDVVSMVIDNECSRFTKANAQLTALEYFEQELKYNMDSYKSNRHTKYRERCTAALELGIAKAKELGLKK